MIVRHKKRPKKKKSRSPDLSVADDALVTALLRDAIHGDPSDIAKQIPDEHHAQIILERLSRHENPSIPLISAINDTFKNKAVQKAVRRVIFKLKNRGIHAEGFDINDQPASNILNYPKEEAATAYVGPFVDTMGFRAVLVNLQPTLKGRDVGAGLVSDVQGIRQFMFGTFSKKYTNEILENFKKEAGIMVQTSLDHAATILEAAYRCHQESPLEIPQDYLELRPRLLEKATLLEQPIVYDFISSGPATERILTDSQLEKLFEHEYMHSCLIHIELLRPFMEEILEVDKSPILLTEAQKRDRIRQIKNKGIQTLFPLPERQRLRRRFEEMAYIFFKIKAGDYGRLSLDAALSIDEKDGGSKRLQIIEFIVEYSINFYMNAAMKSLSIDEKMPEEAAPSSIIIP